jgi:hypothetical protein
LDLDTFIVTTFCLLDDMLTDLAKHHRLRQRGPAPTLADSEVLTIELAGEMLGLAQDRAIFNYFRRHFAHFFPALAAVHRTTFVRQAANLWKVKEALWQSLLARAYADPQFALLDSFPVAVCRFARAPRCKGFRGAAGYGKDHSIDQIFYGFRLHVRVAWPGVITHLAVAPANVSDQAMTEALVEQTSGYVLADRDYWNPELRARLRQQGVELLAPFRKRSRDRQPERASWINHFRYRIETVFSQLTERFQIKRVWARDSWHLASRMMRKVLAHTIAVVINREAGHPPLRLAELLTL